MKLIRFMDMMTAHEYAFDEIGLGYETVIGYH